jgi:predicted ATP-grasp superfamily ATP-dependent carboligase
MALSAPHILIHEYVSGGGWPEPMLPKGLVTEGLAMLQAILKDFRAWKGAKITTTRDHRLSNISLSADRVIDIDPLYHCETIETLSKQCTAVLIIAPESNGVLSGLSDLAENAGAHLLGSSPASIATAADKWACHQIFTRAGLPTPDTWYADAMGAWEKAEKHGLPIVIKPVDGVDCQGVSLIKDPRSLQSALEKNRLGKPRFLLQNYIEGDHASVCLLITKNDILCLSLNKQLIEVGAPFSYQGSKVPFICDKHKEATGMAKRAASLVPGLKGFVGVDIVITNKNCYLIEINPRLTTSYIGLRRIVNINLAEAIWNASLSGTLPQKVLLSGSVVFKKEDLI